MSKHVASRRRWHRGFVVLLAVGGGALGCGKPDVEPAKPETVKPSTAEVPKPIVTSASVSDKFDDQALEAGIAFRMQFLPKEQGENFKINLYDHGCGVVVGDYDGDGHDDLYFLNQLGPNALYKNKGDGSFEDVSEQAGVAVGDRICVAGTFADYDNDGDQDLFVTSTRGGNILFENQGKGRFRDVTKQAGVEHVGHSATATFVDLDNDSFLDLLVTNTAQWTLDDFDSEGKYYAGVADYADLVVCPKEYNIVYHNNGNGTFRDATEESGLKGRGWGGDVAVFDYDQDGQVDLLITNMFGVSQLYRNQGHGTFGDVTKEVLGRVPWGAIGSKVFDFNNDGQLDVFISDMHSDMWVPPDSEMVVDYAKQHATEKYPFVTGAASKLLGPKAVASEANFVDKLQIRYEDVLFGNALFKNAGNGTMEEISDKANMETWWPWAIATGDFDSDGYEDVFLASGMGYPFPYWHNHLMMNNQNETFTVRSSALGIEPPKEGRFLEQKIGRKDAARSSRCAAVGDFDGDGRLEIVTNNFNDRPYYFKNRLPQKNYVAFKLTGTKTNRDAIGAVARLYVGQEVLTRQVNPAGGYLSQSSKTLHFGLGDRTQIDRVEILWPSGTLQKLKAPKINSVHAVEEPKP